MKEGKELENVIQGGERRGTLIMVVLAVVGLGGAFGAWYLYTQFLSEVKSGASLKAAHIASRADGKRVLLLVGDVEISTDETMAGVARRVDLVDLTSGQRLARRVVDDYSEVFPASKGRIWHRRTRPTRLELIDTKTLADSATFEDLVKSTPALAAGLHGRLIVDRWQGDAIVTTNQGEQLVISSTTLKGRPLNFHKEVVNIDGNDVLVAAIEKLKSEADPGIPSGPDSVKLDRKAMRSLMKGKAVLLGLATVHSNLENLPRRLMDEVIRKGKTYSFVSVTGSPLKSLAVSDDSGRAKTTSTTATFLQPQFITMDSESGQSALLPEGRGFLVAHQKTLASDETQKLLVSRVSLSGRKEWTVTRSPGRIILGYLEGDQAVLVVSGAKAGMSAAFGIAWPDGQVRWGYRL